MRDYHKLFKNFLAKTPLKPQIMNIAHIDGYVYATNAYIAVKMALEDGEAPELAPKDYPDINLVIPETGREVIIDIDYFYTVAKFYKEMTNLAQ